MATGKGVAMKLRIGLAIGAIAIGLVLACLPFSSSASGFKGIGSGSMSCSAPIRIGWAGGAANRDVPGGTEYDGDQQCGQDARVRLVIAGAFVLLGVAGLSVTLWRQHRGDYPLPTSW